MIPVTIKEFNSTVWRLPFSIVNAYYKHYNAIGFYHFSGVTNDGPYDAVNAIFRVYPKGQNPLSINKTQ